MPLVNILDEENQSFFKATLEIFNQCLYSFVNTSYSLISTIT